MFKDILAPPPGGGVLPYMGYIGMYRGEWYGFQRVSMGWWLLRLSAKILAHLRLSVFFFSVTVNKKVKN